MRAVDSFLAGACLGQRSVSDTRVVWSKLDIVGLVAGLCCLLVLRAPGYFVAPQFWAEDGRFWYAQAYQAENPWPLLAHAEFGYLHLFPRLVAALSSYFPLEAGPLIFVCAAALLQVGIALLVASPALKGVVESDRARAGLALGFVALPNSYEVQLNLSNTNTLLSFALFLLMVVDKPRGILMRGVLLGAILVAGLSGPFCIMLLPGAVGLWAVGRRIPGERVLAVFAVTAVQVFQILQAGDERVVELGARVGLLLRIVGTQVGIAGLLGTRSLATLQEIAPQATALAAAVGVAVLAIVALAFLARRNCGYTDAVFRAFVIYAALVFAACLLSPKAAVSGPQWLGLLPAGHGNRYFFLPTIALYLSIIRVWGAMPRALSRALAGALIFGFVSDFRLQRRVDYDWRG